MDNVYVEVLTREVKVFNLDRGTSDRYLRLNCPWCIEKVGKEDTDGKLHFYLDSSIARCMRCGAWGTVQRLFSQLGLTLPTDLSGGRFNFAAIFREQMQELLAPVCQIGIDRTQGILEDPPELELPPSSLPIKQLCDKLSIHRRILNLIKDWRLDLSVIHQLRWHWNVPMDAFLFPVYWHTNYPVYWSARSFDGKFRSSAECEFSKFGILGHLDHPLQHATDTLYLVEGPKDSAALIQEGFWAVHLFGHKPNESQVRRLNMFHHKKVLLLDADVTDQAAQLAAANLWETLYLPKGDPADYAGDIARTLTDLWSHQNREISSLGVHCARIRQKLHNPQVHHRKKFSRK